MHPDELLNKYNVLQLLHHGIGGDVWLAEHKALGSKRVLKVIEKNHPQYDVLAREARILQQCQHSSIPIIYDILEFDTQTYIVEEFIQGETLKQYIARQGSLSASLLLEFSIQLCNILIFLHNPARKILHLDLKPENILLVDHKLKLIDFGSAICQRTQNGSEVIFGTPAFCAPEMKTMGKLTERTDIYCMGKCMEYLLFHTPKAPKGYRNIVESCLRKVEKEYADATQVLADLNRIRCKKTAEKNRENWYAVMSALSEQDSSMTALQLAMYLRDRYHASVLCLDCTKEGVMEYQQRKEGDANSFATERKQIKVVRRVALWEVNGWRGRGYTRIVVCLGKQSPLLSETPYRICICTGAVTEFNLEQWNKMLLPLCSTYQTAVALTGGDIALAKKEWKGLCRVQKLTPFFCAFEQSKPFRRQMKHLLDGM